MFGMALEDVHAAKQAVIDCVLDIEQWSSSRRLKLNEAKSEVILARHAAATDLPTMMMMMATLKTHPTSTIVT